MAAEAPVGVLAGVLAGTSLCTRAGGSEVLPPGVAVSSGLVGAADWHAETRRARKSSSANTFFGINVGVSKFFML